MLYEKTCPVHRGNNSAISAGLLSGVQTKKVFHTEENLLSCMFFKMHLFSQPLETRSYLQFLTAHAFFSSTSKLRVTWGVYFFNKVKKIQIP